MTNQTNWTDPSTVCPSALVTIVIPVFNGENYLSAAIDSALAQTWPAVEVLVVDDGSTDGGRTRAIAESYGSRIRFVAKQHSGVASTLNAGIEAMKGEWFSWLSHDDLYHPRKIEAQMAALSASAPGTIAFSDYELINAGGEHLGYRNVTHDYDAERPLWMVLEGRINGCTLLVRRSCLIETGGFHPGLPTTQDYELWFRLLRTRCLVPVPGALVSHRTHDKQGSRTSRHIEEAGLLWREMVESVTPAEMRHHAGSELAFLFRVTKFLAKSSYPAGYAAAMSRLRAQLLKTMGTLVWVASGPPGPMAAIAALREAGLHNISCVVADLAPDATSSLALRAVSPDDAVHVRLRPEDGLTGILAAVLASQPGEIVLMLDCGALIDIEGWRQGIEAVLGGSCDGWLQIAAGANGLLPQAFRGALIARKTIEAALDRCTALGGGDAAMTLGLIARLDHAPGLPGIPIPPAISDVAAIDSVVDEDAGSDVLVEAAAPAIEAPVRPIEPGPRPALATRPLGIWLLNRAANLHRVLSLSGFVGSVVALAFGARGLVDRKAYLASNPDVAAAGVDPIIHYLRHGWREGRSPGTELHPTPAPQLPALATTRVGSRLLDYAERLRQRLPAHSANIEPIVAWAFRARGLVDREAYLAVNADVAAAGVAPLIHYLRHGWREGRAPRPSLPDAPEPILPEAVALSPSTPAAGVDPEPLATSADPDLPPVSPPTPDGPASLLVLHTHGGGSELYVERVAALLRTQGIRPIFAWGIDNHTLAISTLSPGSEEARFALPSQIHALACTLAQYGIMRADILHPLGSEDHLLTLLQMMNVPYDLTFLDYYLFASTPHLLDGERVSPARGQAGEIAALAPMLRQTLHPLISNAERRLACSRDLAARLKRLVPGLDVLPVRPPEPTEPESYRVTPPAPVDPSEPLRILVVGAFVSHKGRDEVLSVATEARRRGLKLEFHHIGSYMAPASPGEQVAAALCLYGAFRREELATLICAIRPHLAWFPTRAPETYGFALSDVMLMGLPIIARGLGAYPERLAGRPYTWVTPPDETSTAFWLERFQALRDSNLMLPAVTPMPPDLPPLADDFYDHQYLEPFRAANRTEVHRSS